MTHAPPGGILPVGCKQLSVLRRMGDLGGARWVANPGDEGMAGVFRLSQVATPVMVEATSGRTMTLVPGDLFLASPGNREPVRWVTGGVPEGGLVPGDDYCLLAESGVVGKLLADSPSVSGGLAQVTYLGAVLGENGQSVRLKDFIARPPADVGDAGAPAYLVLGTSAEVGKTAAGLMLLRSLRERGHDDVVVLKATGTSSMAEVDLYRDFGAAQVFDCADFGVPATFPCGRPDAAEIFGPALDLCFSLPADAVLIECGGDFLDTCVPEFLQCLLARRSRPTTILAASDVAGAAGAKTALAAMGVVVKLITGPCTDTETARRRVETACGTAARNMRVL